MPKLSLNLSVKGIDRFINLLQYTIELEVMHYDQMDHSPYNGRNAARWVQR